MNEGKKKSSTNIYQYILSFTWQFDFFGFISETGNPV